MGYLSPSPFKGFHALCNELEIVDGNAILVKIEVRELGIALEVEKIGI